MQQINLFELLERPKSAGRNQLVSNCPFCNKSGHFYINKDTHLWDCKKCGEHGNIQKLLRKLGRYDLISTVLHLDTLDSNILNPIIQPMEELETREISYPVGFRRGFNDEYLNHRGFRSSDYYKFEVGRAEINARFDNYVIIGVHQNNKLVGYLSRHTWDKAKIKRYEQRTGKTIFRYKNSMGAPFSKLLLGYDEIELGKTETVILVEGFFKKHRVDKLFNLDEQSDIKCCATFGKKVSEGQIDLLRQKGIENVILVQDADAIVESKRDSFLLNEHFSTLVGYVAEGGSLDDCPEREFFKTFDQLETPEKFFYGKVQLLQ